MPSKEKVRELKRLIKTADASLKLNPADEDAKKARIAAVMGLKFAAVSGLPLRRRNFYDELQALADGTTEDVRDAWRPLTRGERLRLMPVVMDIWFLAAYYTGLRDRMRCPRCTSVGTWKMHGTWFERWRWGDVPLRRWGCKFCGHWIAKGWVSPRGDVRSGRIQAFPLSQEGLRVWAYPDPNIEREPTPAEALFADMGRTWPWNG